MAGEQVETMESHSSITWEIRVIVKNGSGVCMNCSQQSCLPENWKLCRVWLETLIEFATKVISGRL